MSYITERMQELAGIGLDESRTERAEQPFGAGESDAERANDPDYVHVKDKKSGKTTYITKKRFVKEKDRWETAKSLPPKERFKAAGHPKYTYESNSIIEEYENWKKDNIYENDDKYHGIGGNTFILKTDVDKWERNKDDDSIQHYQKVGRNYMKAPKKTQVAAASKEDVAKARKEQYKRDKEKGLTYQKPGSKQVVKPKKDDEYDDDPPSHYPDRHMSAEEKRQDDADWRAAREYSGV